jgi:predicted CXXCH cytochrome family protein
MSAFNATARGSVSESHPRPVLRLAGRLYRGAAAGDYWQLEELKYGTTDFYQFADLTAHKNRMQGNDFVQSNMYHRQIRCFDCHDVHNNQNESNLLERGNALCLGCHTRRDAAGLKGTVSERTHHAENSPGSQCAACHMPLIEQTIKDSYVAAHTFRFISPTESEQSGIPNPCTSCHAGKSNAWAIEALSANGRMFRHGESAIECRVSNGDRPGSGARLWWSRRI